MVRIDQGISGKPKPCRCLRNRLIAKRTRTRSGDGPYRLIARDEALCRLRRNEGRICRDLWPRVDMTSLMFGMWFRYSNAWSARKRTMVNPRGFMASSLFFTCSRKT